jgi:hypothetical protein
MSDPLNLQRLTELVGLLCDEQITDEQFAELETLLRENPQARKTYHVLVATHMRLGQLDASEFAAAAADVQAASRGRGPLQYVRRGWRRAVDFVRREPVISACVAIAWLAITIGSLALLPISSPRMATSPSYELPIHVAQIVNLAGPVWENFRDAQPREALLFPGDEIALRSGLMEIRHTSGAIVVIEGPARYVVDDRNSGSLSTGRLLARVSPAATGFVVATPHATIIDLGTEFGVDVSELEQTQAHVFKGKVQFSPKIAADNAAPRTIVLTAGSSIAFNAQGVQRSSNPANPPQFVHRLPPASGNDTSLSSSLLQYRPRVQATARSDAKGTIGMRFEVGDKPLELTHLGVQDVDALNDQQDRDGVDNRTGFADDDGFVQSPISVGVWRAADGALIASAQVASDSPLVGSWRYVELTGKPVALAPYEQYYIGAHVGSGIEWFLDGEGAPTPPPFAHNLRIRALENCYTYDGFAMPKTPGQGRLGRWGPANALFQLATKPDDTTP